MQALSKTAYNCALEMLARREHSYWELTKKLAQQYQADDIEQALSKLQSQNYQSDQRFANEFIQMRFNQGKGPIKIAADLKQRGIDNFDLSAYDYKNACV
jgi:regulatory protein